MNLSSAIAALVTLVLLCQAAIAQTDSGRLYTVNRSARENSCNCFALTPSSQHQSGSVWNKTRIDLSQSFDFHFNIFLGCRSNIHGADGMAFVLQPLSTSVGNDGEGLGFQGIVPSLGIEIDTYQNWNENDPPYDHIAILANGDVNHADSNNLAGPVQALPDSSDIKDCAWHVLEITWDADVQKMTVYMDGTARLSMTRDIVASIFHGHPLVYWGFTAATGAGYNLQEFCTSLNAHFMVPRGQTYCENQPVEFLDSSVSFGPVVQWHWDFGDGSTSSLQNPVPHRYAAPGSYNVIQVIQGTSVCLSDTNRATVKIGSYPTAAFSVSNACAERTLFIQDSSTDSVGTIVTWHWALNNGDTFSTPHPLIVIPNAGSYKLELTTVSDYGCQSITDSQAIRVHATPQVSFMQDSACVGEALVFSGIEMFPVAIGQWYWAFGTSPDSGQSVTRIFMLAGQIPVSLRAESADGCVSDTFNRLVDIQSSQAFAGRDTIVALGYPIQLNASGGTTFIWTPSYGLNDPDIPDPVATLSHEERYTVIASTSAGCTSSASILIKVYKGPEIYVPGAFTPNGDGINDYLIIAAPGIRQLDYFQIFDRWGNEVFRTSDVRAAWDGSFDGKPQPAGTYVWMIRCTDVNGITITKQGTVVLIR